METVYIFIGLVLGGIIGGTIVYFKQKSGSVSRSEFDEINAELIKSKKL
jgi:gas vesicle protein